MLLQANLIALCLAAGLLTGCSASTSHGELAGSCGTAGVGETSEYDRVENLLLVGGHGGLLTRCILRTAGVPDDKIAAILSERPTASEGNLVSSDGVFSIWWQAGWTTATRPEGDWRVQLAIADTRVRTPIDPSRHFSTLKAKPTPASEARTQANWYPDGYVAQQTVPRSLPGLAYRQNSTASYLCNGVGCVAVDVISQKRCPKLEVKVAFMSGDAGGTFKSIGQAAKTISVDAMTPATVRFANSAPFIWVNVSLNCIL